MDRFCTATDTTELVLLNFSTPGVTSRVVGLINKEKALPRARSARGCPRNVVFAFETEVRPGHLGGIVQLKRTFPVCLRLGSLRLALKRKSGHLKSTVYSKKDASQCVCALETYRPANLHVVDVLGNELFLEIVLQWNNLNAGTAPQKEQDCLLLLEFLVFHNWKHLENPIIHIERTFCFFVLLFRSVSQISSCFSGLYLGLNKSSRKRLQKKKICSSTHLAVCHFLTFLHFRRNQNLQKTYRICLSTH